ncbi:tetratricopeptide repeat protein [Actinoplanes sp. RD1]|uniref:tetratricopeptide repeat protein n=1 Tax=Actinoplanes sp. RD1 TaxID=3064538 RepID=UPI0027405009|nr:tetratricopeptide repeat protein [Actinoplanes sp. RD1]
MDSAQIRDQLTAVRLRQAEQVAAIEQWHPDVPISSLSLVSAFEELAATDPGQRPGLVAVLVAASRHLGSLNRAGEALPYATRAVTLARDLADAPAVATALDNLALWLTRCGRPAEALAAIQEAVTIRRRQAAGAELARSLFGLSVRSATPGQAVAAYREAVALLTEAGTADPGGVASALGALDLLVAGPALADRDRMTAHFLLGGRGPRPLDDAADRVTFARNLRVVSMSLAGHGLPEAAAVGWTLVVAAEQSLLTDPAHAEDAVYSIAQIAQARYAAGDGDGALALWDETIGGLRGTGSPPEVVNALADALSRRAPMLTGVARHREALASAEEAVRLRERLSDAYSPRFLPELMLSLNVQSTSLANLDRVGEAVAAGARAVAIARAVAGADAGYRDQLAAGLSDQSALLARAGRAREAMAAAKESLTLYQALDRETGQYREDVISGLRGVAARYHEQGKNFRAQLFAGQAAALLRQDRP